MNRNLNLAVRGQCQWTPSLILYHEHLKMEMRKLKVLYYDVDDGIYFEGDKDAKDRNSTATYHDWVVKAVTGHTDKDPIDKNTCVRTLFSDGHNIDEPIYYKKGDTPELAHKRDGWIESDPKLLQIGLTTLLKKSTT